MKQSNGRCGRWSSWRMMIMLLLGLAPILSGRSVQSVAAVEPVAAPATVDAVPDDSFWNNTGLVAGANNTIRALTFRAGEIFVGGLFDRVGGIAANRVAHWDGERWLALGLGIGGENASVEDMDSSPGGNVYAVGNFSSVGGQLADGIARWNISQQTWTPLATNVNGTIDSVLVVTISNSDVVFVGGSFSSINGVSANRIAKFQNNTWSALGSGIGGGPAPRVHALAVNPTNVNQIVAGGFFSTAGGATANSVAIWNGTSWSALGSGTSNGVDGLVRFLDFRGTNFVVVGGNFLNAGTVNQANGSAAWRGGNTWELFTGKGTTAEVRGIIESGSFTYVGGTFNQTIQPNGNLIGAPALARWDGNIWERIPNGPNSSVLRMERAGSGSSSFFIAGSFGQAGGTELGFVALFSPAVGSPALGTSNVFFPLGGGLEGSSAAISAMQNHADGLFVGGNFRLGSTQFLDNIALFDSDTRTWESLPGANDAGTNDDVHALALRGANELVVVGEFTKAGGIDAARVAIWNIQTRTWSALATTIDGDVHAVITVGSDVLIGGNFTTIDGVAANHVARWNGSTWSALGSGTDGPVHALLHKGAVLFAGGLFANAGGAPASNLARWSGTSWSAIGSGTNGEVRALADTSPTTIAVGGRFTSAGGVAGTSAIAQLTVASNTWAALGSGTDGFVHAIETRGTDIYIGGLFSRMLPSTIVNHVARWNGTSWNPLGSGVAGSNLQNSEVEALHVVGDSLFVGGEFNRAGDKPSRRLAEWKQPEVDLSVKITDAPDPVVIGNEITYRASVSNFGTINASSVIYTHTFPNTVAFGQITTTQGSCSFSNATTVRCTLGTLLPNGRATITIGATPSQVGTVSSTAIASSPAPEAFLSNNDQTMTTSVTPPGNPLPTLSSLSPSSFIRQPISFPPPPPVRITVNGTGFVPNSMVLVNGNETTTTFLDSNRVQFSMASTSSTGGYQISVRNPTPGGGESNALRLGVSLGIVGLSSVTPNSGGTAVDLLQTFTISWTHTTEEWRILEHLDLRLVDETGIGVWARFTEGISGTFSLLDSNGEVMGYATVGSSDSLESDTAILDVPGSSFAGSGPTGFSMQATFALRFKAAAAGRTYNIELYATDDLGDIQGPDVLGSFTVGNNNIYLPVFQR